ncbi:hypothetical protein JMJ77_0011039 [Colletotrichum scovillei]|uniref:Uncharacterized protein n=1 Tax=Colletotrichum scovillei TaxID=1209932 RepID=A0A9P7U9P7_9PEZI|nr:hypothetical protein JMJ77_0011039 [Colletotrichum scovillei]KAG7060010.1 hypothetical protein JMJ78_0015292 [Colletotrichum scovillei]KAG7067460.1 hypothetical protein JMJ76_0008895 [Colletotrichum scovillei]
MADGIRTGPRADGFLTGEHSDQAQM